MLKRMLAALLTTAKAGSIVGPQQPHNGLLRPTKHYFRAPVLQDPVVVRELCKRKR